MSRIKAVFIFFLSFLIIFPTLQIKKADAAPRIEYLGQARYGIYEVGKFRVDGKLAFCIDHYKQSPPTGTSYSPGRIYSNESVRAILHYGAGGPEAIVGTNDAGIVATSLALDSVVNGNHSSGRNSVPGYKELMAHAEAKDAPSDNIDFSKYSLNSSVSGNRQISERVTFEADSRNSIRIPVPQNVTLHIVGEGSYM
ncbi:thioester domain-containing protein [Aeribacillus pallidus]|nr:thioester domain-containing protein [Aeribacillus pallidus]